MRRCVLCVRTDTGRGKGGKLIRNKFTEGVETNEAEIIFRSDQLTCGFCLDEDCMKALPAALKDYDNYILLNKTSRDFTITIHNKNYTFPNDKRIINGIPNRIKEIIKKHDQHQKEIAKRNQEKLEQSMLNSS